MPKANLLPEIKNLPDLNPKTFTRALEEFISEHPTFETAPKRKSSSFVPEEPAFFFFGLFRRVVITAPPSQSAPQMLPT